MSAADLENPDFDNADLGQGPYIRLKTLMTRLRTDCPWDSAQNFDTIAPYTIEEAYEVSEAIAQQDMAALKVELGDLLFQVLFHAIMADEAGAFDLDDVCEGLITKMVDRHPHVFGDKTSEADSTAQKQAWEDIKARERAEASDGNASVLADLPLAFPALIRAEKLQKRAARVGFDWPDISGVLDKISEEAQEVAQAAATDDLSDREDEIGDLLFSVTNLARWLGVDPEKALRRTNRKFTHRFQAVEATARSKGVDLTDMSLAEMEAAWQAAKATESASG